MESNAHTTDGQEHPSTLELVATFRRHIEAVSEETDRRKIEEALLLAIKIHEGQMRGADEPYINHVLQVAIRVAKNMPQFPARILAALFHDGPEDQAHRLAALTTPQANESTRDRAFRALQERFGSAMMRIVKMMTNPVMPPQLPRDQKNALYAEHVQSHMQDDDFFWTKLSDAYENAVEVPNNPDPTQRLKMSRKYSLILPFFIERLSRADIRNLPDEKRLRAIHTLTEALENMRRFIADQEQ